MEAIVTTSEPNSTSMSSALILTCNLLKTEVEQPPPHNKINFDHSGRNKEWLHFCSSHSHN